MPNVVLTEEDRVENIEGTRACAPRGFNNSWKQYWKDNTGKDWPPKCPIFRCTNSPCCGGHVHIDGHSTKVYIIPMCNSCNNPQNKAWMMVKTRTEAVDVEKADTSGPEGTCYK